MNRLPYNMNGRPLLWFAVCFVFGSAAAAGWSGSGLLLCGGGLALLLAALAAGGRLSVPLAAACLAACAFAAGERMWVDARGATALPDLLAAAEAQYPPPEVRAEAAGTIVSPVDIDGDLVSFRMTAETVAVIGEPAPRALRERLLVKVRLQRQPEQLTAAAWKRGDRVRAAGTLALPAEAVNRGGFDYRRHLRSQGIHWLLQADGAAAVEAAPGSPFSAASLLARVDHARAVMGEGVDRLYPDEQSGYMKGLVLGITDDVDPGLYRQFSSLGLTHILAISGLHVAVVLFVIGTVLRLLRQPRERILGALMAAVPIYVLLSGASPSVIRAGIMAVLALAAARMNKLKDGLHLLAASAVLMLVWNPLLIENVSFQLSYLVTAGLIIGVPMVNRLLPQGKRGKRLREAAVVTVTAQAASFPLTVYYFNQFHLLSLPANFVLVPLISAVIMPLGAISLFLLPFWPYGAGLLAGMAAFGNKGAFALIGWMNGAESLRTVWASPPLWWIAAWYGAVAILLIRLAAHKRTAAMFRGLEAEASGLLHTGAPDTVPLARLRPQGVRSVEAYTRDRRHLPGGASGSSSSARHVQSPEKALSIGASLPSPAMTAPPEAHDCSAAKTGPLGAGVDYPVQTGPYRANQSGLAARPPGGGSRAASMSRGGRVLPALWTAVTAFSILLLLLYAWNPGWNDRTARVSVLDVGQGDSILVRTPEGKHMLIDGGGTVSFLRKGEEWRKRRDPFEIGRKTLVPLLMKRGVKEIDLLVISHLDTDHIGGLQAVLESIPVRRIVWNGSVKRSADAVKLLQTALKRHIPLYGAHIGQMWRIDGESTLEVLWPRQLSGQATPLPAATPPGAAAGTLPVTGSTGAAAGTPPVTGAASGSAAATTPVVPEIEAQNEAGVVSLLTIYGRTFLLAGDVGTATEEAILEEMRARRRPLTMAASATNDGDPPSSQQQQARRADVLKVGHHGSRFSTGGPWLAYWRPLAAAISVGRNNVYRHPSEATLQRLGEAHISVWRTDRSGEIAFLVEPSSSLYVQAIDSETVE